jgi:hypothetical protein
MQFTTASLPASPEQFSTSTIGAIACSATPSGMEKFGEPLITTALENKPCDAGDARSPRIAVPPDDCPKRRTCAHLWSSSISKALA